MAEQDVIDDPRDDEAEDAYAIDPRTVRAITGDVVDHEVDGVLTTLQIVHQTKAVEAPGPRGALEAGDRVAVQRALSYPEYSAGRLMQREVVTAPEHWTVGDAIDYMRTHQDLPDQFYHIILVDPRHRPQGYVTLGKVMSSRRETPLADLAESSFRAIPVLQDEEDIAYAFNQYHLISAPVVDEDGRLVGVITIDDAMAVLSEENEEDLLRLA
ncbi:hypothetical protein LCGC14_2044080, partial [marine sediment metagenome]